MTNVVKKIVPALIVSVFMLSTVFGTLKASAAYYEMTDGRTWQSIIGLDVVEIVLHANGESTPTYGRVDDVWMSSWSIFPNFVSDKYTWTTETYNGEWAKGTATRGVGFDSPIGVIGGSATEYFQILF